MTRNKFLATALMASLPFLSMQAGSALDPEHQAAPGQPDEPAPVQPPPPPPSKVPTPPARQASRETPRGQWVHTSQYGWVWMPYGEDYVHSPVIEGDAPLMFLYYPAIGWCWVDAPWVWGWGPMPYFGVVGTIHFGWWGHGYGHWYGFRGPGARPLYRGRGYWHDGAWHGARPSAPPRVRIGR